MIWDSKAVLDLKLLAGFYNMFAEGGALTSKAHQHLWVQTGLLGEQLHLL